MATKSSKILILEHSHNDAEMIEAQLHRVMLPVRTKRASSKEMFLKAIPEFVPDIIIADYSVPKFDILAALRQAQIDLPGVPWIVLSAVGTEDALMTPVALPLVLMAGQGKNDGAAQSARTQ